MVNLTTQQMADLIGKKLAVEIGRLIITCQVLDVKKSYGHVRFLVRPENGLGEVWVDASKVRF